jgi:ketosteroid isomerase-like protein
MGEDNVAIVEELTAALNRRDVDAVVALAQEDCEVDFTRSRNPDIQGVYRGRDELRRILLRLLEPWEKFELYADEYIDHGDIVIRVGGFRGSGKGSGVEVEGHGAQINEFRDGRLVALRQCQSKEQALEVARGRAARAD